MSPTRSRAVGLAVATSLALTAAGMSAPVAAAGSPEDAVNQLLDASMSGDYDAIDALVCEAERAAVRSMLDPGEAMDSEVARDLIRFSIEDRALEVLDQGEDEATVRVTGLMSMGVDEADVETVARALLEADADDMSEEDFEMMLPFVETALNQTEPIDEELTIIREDGEWVVCGGLGEPEVDDEFGVGSNVSSEGVCGLATPEELTAVGVLEYDTSSGFVLTSCVYSTSDFELYHSATVSVELDTSAELVAGAYGADQQMEVAGAPAFAGDTLGVPLLVQVGTDMLNISLWPPEPAPEGYDGQAQAMALAELFVPRVAESRDLLIEPTPPLLCDLTFAADFEAAHGLPIHSGSVSSDFCSYESRDSVSLNVNAREGTLDEYSMFYPDAEELTVAGLPALRIEQDFAEGAFDVQVQLPDERVLSVSVQPAFGKTLELPAAEVAELLTQHILDKSAE